MSDPIKSGQSDVTGALNDVLSISTLTGVHSPFLSLGINPKGKKKTIPLSPRQGNTPRRFKHGQDISSTDFNTSQHKMASNAPAIDPNQTIYVRNLNEKINKIGMLSCASLYLPLYFVIPFATQDPTHINEIRN